MNDILHGVIPYNFRTNGKYTRCKEFKSFSFRPKTFGVFLKWSGQLWFGCLVQRHKVDLD